MKVKVYRQVICYPLPIVDEKDSRIVEVLAIPATRWMSNDTSRYVGGLKFTPKEESI